MEIIIPANRIEGDINSQVIVDNEITKVVVKNYTVTKKSSEEAEDITAYTSDYADNAFKSRSYYISNKSLTYDYRRIETFYTTGYIEATINQNIGDIENIYSLVNGKLSKGVVGANHTTMENPTKNDSWWNNEGEDTYLYSNFVTITKNEDFSDKALSSPNFKKTTLPNDTTLNIKSISVVGSSYVIGIEFNILTKTRQYIYRSPNIFGIDDKHSFEEYKGETFSIKLDISTVGVDTKDNLSLTYGEGSKTLSYNTNELFQLENTYNDGEKEVPIGEFVANQVIAMYKDGRKTATMTALTDNLLVSNNKLENGHYGVYGRLERQIYKVGDNVIPYKIDKSLKELPNSEYLGIPQSFKVAENEVRYEGKLTQNLTTQENTYFNISYDEDLLDVRRNNILIGSGDRIFREEELSIVPEIPYSDDYVPFLEINGNVERLFKDSSDNTKYRATSTKVNGFLSLDLTKKDFVIISSGETEETFDNPKFAGSGSFGLAYSTPLTNFNQDAIHRLSITAITEWRQNTILSPTRFEETKFVFSVKNKGYEVNSTVGKMIPVQLKFYLANENTISIDYENSSFCRLVSIKINSVAQVED